MEEGMRTGTDGRRDAAVSVLHEEEEGMRTGADGRRDAAVSVLHEMEEGRKNGVGERDGSIPENIAGNAGENMGEDSLLAQIMRTFPGKRTDVRTYSPLALAYIGDAVYDLIIRTVVVERGNRSSQELHRITVKYVSAGAQAKMVQALADRLTEEEAAVYRRGKNAKPHTMAKNASAADYLKATGFEAVIGYLYLTDRMDRILELVDAGIRLAGMGI